MNINEGKWANDRINKPLKINIFKIKSSRHCIYFEEMEKTLININQN